jgi:hypothetical protein
MVTTTLDVTLACDIMMDWKVRFGFWVCMVIPNLYSSFIQFKLHTHIVTSIIEMLVPVRSEHVRALYLAQLKDKFYIVYASKCVSIG